MVSWRRWECGLPGRGVRDRSRMLDGRRWPVISVSASCVSGARVSGSSLGVGRLAGSSGMGIPYPKYSRKIYMFVVRVILNILASGVFWRWFCGWVIGLLVFVSMYCVYFVQYYIVVYGRVFWSRLLVFANWSICETCGASFRGVCNIDVVWA